MKQNIFQLLFPACRKYFIAAFLLISVSSFAAGPDNISEKISSNFAAHFKNAVNVNWTETDIYSAASFEWLNEKMNAYYDNEGKFYCLSKPINSSSLPEKALKTISEKFSEGVIMQAIEMNKGDAPTEYYVSLETAKASLILQISENGKVSVFKKTNK